MLLQLESGICYLCRGLEVISCHTYRLEPFLEKGIHGLVKNGVIQTHVVPQGGQFF